MKNAYSAKHKNLIADPQVNHKNTSSRSVALALSIKLGHIFSLPFFRLAMPKNRWLILVTLFAICTLIYYFGELLDFVGWEALRWRILDDVHDIHRLLFFAPIMYACYFLGTKAMVAVTGASLIVFLPRAIFISPFPDAPVRSLIFVISAGVLCSLIRISRNRIQKRTGVEIVVRNERNGFVGVQNRIEDGILTTGELEIDLSRRLVKHRGQNIKLTPTEYKLLIYLVRNSEKALSRKDLLQHVWGPEYNEEREYLRNYIRQLRLKIEDDPANPKFIVTESGFGYRFTWSESIPNNKPSQNNS